MFFYLFFLSVLVDGKKDGRRKEKKEDGICIEI